MAEVQEPAEVVLKISLPESARAEIQFVEIQHSLVDTISDVRQTLTATSYLNKLTNYSLVYKDVVITDKFDEWASLAEVFGEESGTYELTMTERPYNLKDVYEHLLRFRELIGMNFFDRAARAHGFGAGGVKMNGLGLRPVNVDQEAKKEAKEEGEEKKEQVEISDEDRQAVRDFVKLLIDTKPFDLKELATSETVLSKWKPPIKSLQVLQWSVPELQRLKGDILYLQLTTWESETFSITCHASGFFVNRLSNANFDPSLKVNEKGKFHKEYVFYNLISDLSPKFSEIVKLSKEAMASSSAYAESFLIPTQSNISYPWAVSEQQIKEAIVPDSFRAQIPILTNGVDRAENVKDWNDEFQGIKEFSREAFHERLLRDRLLNKYIQDYTATAVPTAMEIVKGNIPPMNPNEEHDKQIFLRNNIFYSFAVNATSASGNHDENEGARYCFNKDLATVKLMNRLDLPNVSNLLTCIVDYLGERVICQAPVPGIFSEQTNGDPETADKIVHGHAVESNKIYVSDEFNELLKPVAEAFHLKTHKVELESGAASKKELTLSKDTKGIVGTDNRNYVIDLYRTTPLDITFLDAHYDKSETSYPHKEASLRHDAVEEWYRRKAAAYFKIETERLEKEGKLGADGEKPKVAIPFDQIVLNADAFTGVNESKEDQEAVREVSLFVKDKLVPELLDEITQSSVPFDGKHLTAFMHRNGINMRYLGHLSQQALQRVSDFEKKIEKTIADNEVEKQKRDEEERKKKEEQKNMTEEQLKESIKAEEEKKKEETKKETAAQLIPMKASMQALYVIAVQEMVARGFKHVVRKVGAQVPHLLKPHLIAHLHNCLLGTAVNSAPEVHIDESIRGLFNESELQFTKLSPAEVRELLEKEVFIRFRYHLPENWITELIKPMQLLREIAQKIGIQWKAQQFFFSKEEFEANNKPVVENDVPVETKGKKKGHQKASPAPVPQARSTVFLSEDIVALLPVVKDSSYRCSLVDEVYETARVHFQKGEEDIGNALISELVTFYNQIYGTVNNETGFFYSTLAQFYAERKMFAEASIAARKALLINERITGTDSYETINAYVKASYFDSLNNDHVSAFKLNGKALDLWSVIYGEDHPNTVNTLSNFGTILLDFKLLKESKKFFEKAIDLSVKINGEQSDITGLIRHRLAVALVQDSNFKAAKTQFAKAADIFNKVVGPDDVMSKECSNFVAQIDTYLAYNEHKLAEMKKQSNKNGKPKPVTAEKAPQPPASKNGKKKKNTPVPEIANKSVDEILQFIEGNLGSKPKNKKH